MTKYIVKNCQNLSESYYADGHISKNECSLEIDDKQCSDCTDCLIKQVIEKCREECDPTNDDWCRVKENLSREFLQLFEIEECE